MLASLIGLYVVSARELGRGTFDFPTLVGLEMDPNTQKMLFLGFFFAFAIKAPLWPFHTWLAGRSSAVHTRHVGATDRRSRQGGNFRHDPLLLAYLPGSQ